MAETNLNGSSPWKSRLELFATALLVLVTLMVGAFAIEDRFLAEPKRPGLSAVTNPIPIPIGDAPVKGSREAKVGLVVFSDFQCPVCAQSTKDLLPELASRYIDTGKVLLVFYHDPLPMHAAARGAAEAAECADRQGRFWDMHDWAFDHQQSLGAMRDGAKALGLDMPAFDKCASGQTAEKIKSDLALAKKLEVVGTPTWFIGTVEPTGAVKPVDQIVGLARADVYRKAIDKLLQSQ